MQFEGIPGQLDGLASEVFRVVGNWSQEEWQTRSAPEKWSRVEILGHLVDSARNNTERLVRALSADSLEWPSYRQNEQVSVQRYHESPAAQTLALWVALKPPFGVCGAGGSGREANDAMHNYGMADAAFGSSAARLRCTP